MKQPKMERFVEMRGKMIGEGVHSADRRQSHAQSAHRAEWAEANSRDRGPIQYYGPTEVCDQPTRTLLLERGK